MPAYGKNLSPPQVTALVSFLETLRGDGLAARAQSGGAASCGRRAPSTAP